LIENPSGCAGGVSVFLPNWRIAINVTFCFSAHVGYFPAQKHGRTI